RHGVTLTGLEPATRYTFRIHATRTNGPDAELVSSFRTQAPEATGPCEVGPDGRLHCPATARDESLVTAVLPEGADPHRTAVVSVTDLDMGAAVAAVLAGEEADAVPGEPAVTVHLGDEPYGAALLDAQALQRAAG